MDALGVAIVSLFGMAFLATIGAVYALITAELRKLAKAVEANSVHLQRLSDSWLKLSFRVQVIERDLWESPPRDEPET